MKGDLLIETLTWISRLLIETLTWIPRLLSPLSDEHENENEL